MLRSAAGSVAHCWVDAHPVQSMLPVGLPADVRSCASTPKHRFATCVDPFGSPWLRKSNPFPLRPRRRCVHSGRAVGRRLPGEPIVVFRRTVDRRLLVASVGADPPARQGGCGGTAHFHSPQWSSRRDRSSDEARADRSGCTVGPLVGFAFGLVSPATSFIARARCGGRRSGRFARFSGTRCRLHAAQSRCGESAQACVQPRRRPNAEQSGWPSAADSRGSPDRPTAARRRRARRAEPRGAAGTVLASSRHHCRTACRTRYSRGTHGVLTGYSRGTT